MRRALGCAWLLVLGMGLAAAPASAVTLGIDPAQSSLTPSVGPAQPLSGSLTILLGAEPPLSGNTTFDITALFASGAGITAVLDPTLANPGAGVLSPSGAFLIPNLFLRLSDGVSLTDLTVPNVTGTYGALPGCPIAACLETSFAIDTGGPAGIVSVHVVAVPEPGTFVLLAGALTLLAGVRRAGARGVR